MSALVREALRRSREHNEIVSITAIEAAREGISLEAIHRELYEACEGEVIDTVHERHEYWGHGTDGADDEPWRVHVPARRT